jgi:hypothetical protein
MKNTSTQTHLHKIKPSWVDQLWNGLPLDDFDPSLIRTPDDAYTLISEFEPDNRGSVAKWLYEKRFTVPNEAVHRGLIDAWAYDHEGVIAAFGDSEFVDALRQVSPPSNRKEPVRAWRGFAGLEGVYGVSWTTDRDIACWFAMRHYEHHQNPFVFFCDLVPGEIIAEQRIRGEWELIVDPKSLIGRAMLDANISIEAGEMKDNSKLPPRTIVEWRLGCERYADAKAARARSTAKNSITS